MTRRYSTTLFARAALGCLCALLLFAQQVGLSHALWHATAKIPQQAEVSRQAGSGNAPAPQHASKLCPLDAALGQVLGAGPVSGFTFHHAAAGTHTPSSVVAISFSSRALAPRSRGPPAFV